MNTKQDEADTLSNLLLAWSIEAQKCFSRSHSIEVLILEKKKE
jgi:hypothetical protein